MTTATDTSGHFALAHRRSTAFGGGVDRSRAFLVARRHTSLVRLLRVGLPLASLALLASYGLFLQRTVTIGGGQLTVGPVALSTEYLTMHTPRYEGFNSDGSRFVVTARSAVQDLKQNAPIKLLEIAGKISHADNRQTSVAAAHGTYDSKAEQLELHESIDVKSSDGTTARLTRATVHLKQGRIVSEEPVAVEMPAGTLRSNAMAMQQKTRTVTFSGGVVARLAAPEAGAQPRPPAAAPSFIGEGGGPVDVTSPLLTVDDAEKTAVFSGEVRAVQGEAVLTASELAAHYEGGAEPAAGRGRIRRLVARDNVVIVRGADRVSADRAEFDAMGQTSTVSGHVVIASGSERQATSDQARFDARSDTVLLTGSVAVQQGRNLLRGRRLLVDQKNATSLLSAPAEPPASPGRISARFYQTEAKGSAGSAAPAAAGREEGLATFRTDPNAPIDIEADQLEVDDRDRTATFRGDVRAVQGDFTIRTSELTAAYTGQAGLGLAEQPSAAAKAPLQIQKILARKKVVVSSRGEQSATGNWAEFDLKTNTAVIGGDVVLSQARNVVRGPRLVIDMQTGQSRMEGGRAPASEHGGKAAPAVSAAPADGRAEKAGPPAGATGGPACGGRMCAVFYPKDATDAAQRGLEAVRGAGAAKDQREAPKRRPDDAPEEANPNWTSTTRP